VRSWAILPLITMLILSKAPLAASKINDT
jgi:hypothetical protein